MLMKKYLLNNKYKLFLAGNFNSLFKGSKKIVIIVGTAIFLILCFSLTKFRIESQSISLLQHFNIKIFCLLSMTILTVLTLDYLIKYIIYNYLYKNKDLIINKNYPTLVYNYLKEIKLFSELGISFKHFYLYYFLIYFLILLIYIFIFIFLV